MPADSLWAPVGPGGLGKQAAAGRGVRDPLGRVGGGGFCAFSCGWEAGSGGDRQPLGGHSAASNVGVENVTSGAWSSCLMR